MGLPIRSFLQLQKATCFLEVLCFINNMSLTTLIKKKIKFSSYIRKFRMEQLQSHRWLTVSSYMEKFLRISLYFKIKPFLIYDFATAPL